MNDPQYNWALPVTAVPTSVQAQGSIPQNVLDYEARVRAYEQAMRDKGYLVEETIGAAPPGLASKYQNFAEQNTPVEDLFRIGRQFVTNKGKRAKTKANPNATIWSYGRGNDGTQYRITNERGQNQVLYSGTGAEGLDKVYEIARGLSTDGGTKADWKVEVLNPNEQQWRVYADDDPKGNLLGKLADIALPIAGAFLLPGIGGLAGALGGVGAGAAGAAAGSALSGTLQGRSIGDILKSAALSGGLSYLGGSLLQGGLGGGAPSSAAGIGGSAATQNAIANAATSAASGLGSAGEIVVNGVRQGIGSLGSALASGAGGALAGSAFGGSGGTNGVQPDGSIQVTGQPGTPGAIPGTVAGGAIGGAANGVQPDGSIQVTGNQPANNIPGQAPISGLPGAIDIGASSMGGQAAQDAATGNDGKGGGFDISKLPSYLQLAALVSGAAGSLFGGNGGGSGNNTIPGGLGGGGFNPVFNAQLPTNPTIPGTGGLTAGQLGPRVMPDQDWTKYAMKPEQSFFKHVPENVQGLARGGQPSFAVEGAGDGRDDHIPAMLSDGEYVIDAETVALLGNGSNKAGADKLDQFRINIRKHKGKALASGKISSDARNPERYLAVR